MRQVTVFLHDTVRFRDPILRITSIHSCGDWIATWGSTKGKYKKKPTIFVLVYELQRLSKNQIRSVLFGAIVVGTHFACWLSITTRDRVLC